VPRYAHLTIPTAPTAQRFTSTRSARPNFALPPRNRALHAGALIGALNQAAGQVDLPQFIGNGFYVVNDLTLTFESEPDFPLAFESLDLPRSGIDLLAVSQDAQGRTLATVRVPQDKVPLLLRKLEAYRDNDPAQALAAGQPKKQDNRKLVESISQIRRATLRQLWTDLADDYPQPGVEITWEVWLRRAGATEQAPDIVLREAQNDLGYTVVSQTLNFIDRSVVLVRATLEQLSLGVDILGIIAEVRKAKVTADFFLGLPVAGQHEVIANLNGWVVLPDAAAPAVALLDTGVNRAHPLLAPIIADVDLHTHDPAWGVHDDWPHGTGMAGLALYGDLTDVLAGNGPVVLRHRLQSHKLIDPDHDHAPSLYGAVTIEGIARLEVDPAPKRVYCMAVTTDGKDRGRPSSWSSAVDNLAAGVGTDRRRLIILSAGNTLDQANYPNDNQTASVQDPAQSWNALTVGGTTGKALINQQLNPGFQPLAQPGDIAPTSTTSLIWPRTPRWPFKPDIVMEAGNMARSAPNANPQYIDELTLLTTNYEFAVGQRPLVRSHDTSAASALASRLAASLWALYPHFTPETIRALLVHSAQWTPVMLQRWTDAGGTLNVVNLLRTFGYGQPNDEALFASAANALTLIAQSTIQPFLKEEGTVKTRDLNLHALPWPIEALQELPLDTTVKLRVTLSYFVEPSPGERGWDKKYGYASHGLRFAVKRPTEDVEQFTQRINAYGRDENYDADAHQGDTGTWMLGTNTPANGSIHSNIWTGTAAQLANRTHIAIYPTLGWRKTRPREERYDRTVHYSLTSTRTSIRPWRNRSASPCLLKSRFEATHGLYLRRALTR
jgi:hypothetical protein